MDYFFTSLAFIYLEYPTHSTYIVDKKISLSLFFFAHICSRIINVGNFTKKKSFFFFWFSIKFSYRKWCYACIGETFVFFLNEFIMSPYVFESVWLMMKGNIINSLFKNWRYILFFGNFDAVKCRNEFCPESFLVK